MATLIDGNWGDEVQLTGTLVVPVSPDPTLVKTIRNYTNALQYLVDEILRDPSSYGHFKYSKRKKKLTWTHNIRAISSRFYEELKTKFNLPGARAQDCIREAIAIVKSAINNPKNKDNAASIRTYRMRVRNQNWKFFKVRGRVVEILIGGVGYIKVKDFPMNHYRYFKNWKQGDLVLILKNNEVKAYISFKITKIVRSPSLNCLAVDLNFDEIVIGNLREELRIGTPMQKIMHIKKHCIERLQKKYNKTWLRINKIKRRISSHWKRVSNIIDDFAKRVSGWIVTYAIRNNYDTIVLEDLNGLKLKQLDLKKKSWRERFTFFAYRKLQQWIEWQAKKDGLAVIYVDPNGTSIRCPICKEKTTKTDYRKRKCSNCNVEFDRDSLAVKNLTLKLLEMWGVEVHPEWGEP